MNVPQVQVWSHCTYFSPLLFCSLFLIIFVVIAVDLCLVCSLKDSWLETHLPQTVYPPLSHKLSMCLFVCILMSEAACRGQERRWVSRSLSHRWFSVAQHECWKLNLGYLEEKEHSYLLSHLSYPLRCRLYFSRKYFEISAEHNARSFINSEFGCVKWDELIKYWVNQSS